MMISSFPLLMLTFAGKEEPTCKGLLEFNVIFAPESVASYFPCPLSAVTLTKTLSPWESTFDEEILFKGKV